MMIQTFHMPTIVRWQGMLDFSKFRINNNDDPKFPHNQQDIFKMRTGFSIGRCKSVWYVKQKLLRPFLFDFGGGFAAYLKNVKAQTLM